MTPLTQPPGRSAAARAHHARRGRGVAARAAPGRRAAGPLVAGDQAGRAPRAPSSTAPSASVRCWGSCARRIWTRRSTSPTTRRSASRAGSSRSTIARSSAGSTDRGRQPLRQPAHHRRHRRRVSPSAAGRPHPSGQAPRPAGRTTCCSSPTGARSRMPARVSAECRRKSRRCSSAASAKPGPRKQAMVLRASAASYALAWREPLRSQHEPIRILRRAQRVPLPPVPARARAGGGGIAGRAARPRPGAARRLHLRRAADGQPVARATPGPWLGRDRRRRGRRPRARAD